MTEKLFVEDLDVRGKRVLVRVDFNVPLQDGKISDDRRIQASLPTIQRLVSEGGRVILMSHLGRPKGQRVAEMSLAPAAKRLSELLGKDVPLADDCIGRDVESRVEALTDGDVLVLENLRFHEGETKNDADFARQLARLGEIYVNDAFGTAHRAHASTEGVTHYIDPCAAGYLLKKELDYLGQAIKNAEKPFVAIIGGAKISSKITVLRALLDKVDALIVGGGMAYTFYKAQGWEIGQSLLEESQMDTALEVMEAADNTDGVELLLPVDCVVAAEPSDSAEKKVVSTREIPADMEGLDIGPETIEIFCERVRNARTVVWNGPMGMFEVDSFATGTNAVAQALADATAKGATTIIGGGDSAAAIQKAKLDEKVSHVSTGGGASLEFLEGKVLPGVEALSEG